MKYFCILVYFSVITITNKLEAVTDQQNAKAGIPTTTRAPLICKGETEGHLTWPDAIAGDEEVYPEEYCFKSDTFRLSRKCVLLNESVAQWLNPDETCEIASKCSVTDELLSIDTTDSSVAVTLEELSDRYAEFCPLDVYIMMEIFTKISSRTSHLVYTMPDVVNNILKIDKSQLNEAQNKMFATDLWLQYIFKYGAHFNEMNYYYLLENVVYLLMMNDYEREYGFILQNIQSTIIGNYVFTYRNLQEILKFESLEDGYYINEDYYTTTQGLFTVIGYTNNGLFLNKQASMNVSTIWDRLDDFSPNSKAKVTIIHKIKSNPTDVEVKCVYWKVDSDNHIYGHWESNGWLKIFPPFYICSFSPDYRNIAMTIEAVSLITPTLQDILDSFDRETPIPEIYGRLLQASVRYDEFHSIDVDLVSQILQKLSKSNETDLDTLVIIINNLQNIDRSILSETGSTDNILFSIDIILQNYQEEYQSSEQFTLLNNFTVLIYDPANITTLLLFNDNSYEIFKDDIEIDILLSYDTLISAFVLNPELKAQIDNDSKIIVTIFLNDYLFNEKSPSKNKNSVSKIFGIILPIFDNLTQPIRIFHYVESNFFEDECVHWAYDPPENITGFWKNNSKSENYFHLVRCDFWHTTHFALLLLDEDKYQNFDTLDYITTVNFSISLLGFLLIILTAVFFKQWRSTTANKVLLQFVISCVLQIVAFYVSSFVKSDPLCILSGFFLHYCILSQFCWMLIVAISQYRRYVVIFQAPSKRILLKTSIFVWILPILPPIVVLSVDKNNYLNSKTDMCYPSGDALYFGVWLPIAFVLLLNIFVFVYIIKILFYSKSNASNCANFNKKELVYKWRLVIFLFFMLGLTWIFGFLSELDGGVVFAYLFCILATLQGFFMFLFFIVLNENSRKMFWRSFKSRTTDSVRSQL